ncbi:MAG: neutral/alkaline non-lysosomal ceramidase N-terminal domain-containing protein [Candidatus Sigynarchaeota archaeon]
MLAGFCKVVITPPLGQVAFAGYNGRKHLPRGVLVDDEGNRHEIYARALVLDPDGNEDPGKVACIVSSDLFMIRNYWVEQVRALAEKLTGGHVPGKNICIHATHSHQAPDSLGIYYPGHDFDGSYLDEAWLGHLARQVAGAIFGAWKARRPALLSTGEGMLEGHTINRRDMGLFDTSSPPNPRTIDPQVPVIIVHDLDGTPRVVITAFATHPTFLSTFEEWSGEHVPFLEQEAKRAFGQQVELMYFTGQAGDIIPGHDPEERTQIVLNPKGWDLKPYQVPLHVDKREGKLIISQLDTLARRIDVTREAISNGLRTELDVDSRIVDDALEIDVRPDGNPVIRDVFATVSRLAHARRSMALVSRFAKDFVGEMARVRKKMIPGVVNDIRIDRESIDIEIDDVDMAEQYSVLVAKSSPEKGDDGKVRVKSEVQGILIGRTYIMCLPSEPINEIGMRLKKLVQEQAGTAIDHVFLFQMCNDGFGYVVTPFEHEAGGYEVSIFCFGKRNGFIIEAASLRLASRMLGKSIEWKDVPLPDFQQAPWPDARQKARDEWINLKQSAQKTSPKTRKASKPSRSSGAPR